MALQVNDLEDIVETTVHIDEYRSKMGDDSDVITLNFKVKYYDPAVDLVNFIEKGYDWVLDADISTGEMEDGSYLVFVELQRRPSAPGSIYNLVKDLQGITANKLKAYTFKYYKDNEYHPLTIQAIQEIVPLTPRSYKEAYGDDSDEINSAESNVEAADGDAQAQLESLQTAAGIPIKAKPIRDEELRRFVNLSKR
jgi:hypothetical protein